MQTKNDYVLAIDIAKFKSMFYLVSVHGEVLLEPTDYDHTLSNFKSIDQLIRKEGIKNNLSVFMESTSTYHYPVMRYFLENEYDVIVVNPNLVKKSSTSFRRTKTDRLDTLLIADTYFKEEIKSNAIRDDILYNDLQSANRQYLSVEKALTAIKNRYTRLLDICIPEHKLLYNSKNDRYLLKYINLFEEFPHTEYLQTTRVDKMATVLNKTFNRDYRKRLTIEAAKIKEISKNSYPGVSKDSNEVENLKQTITTLKHLLEQSDLARERLITLGKQTKEFEYIISVNGIGEQSTSQLIAELGDLSRFKDYKQINAYCGLEPSIYQSGKAFYNGKITKAGNPFARKVIFTTIMSIVRTSSKSNLDHPIHKYYLNKKEKESKTNRQSVIATSTKLIRILFSLCKNESIFTL